MSESSAAAAPDGGIPTFAELSADPEIALLLTFTPVPRSHSKANGWTADMQRMFIAWLAYYGSPTNACDELGKARSGIDKVYKDDGAESFRAAWEAAVALAEKRRIGRMATRRGGAGAMRAPSMSRHPVAAPGVGVAPRPPLPVVCDSCAAIGIAGDEAFAGIPDILAFDPVPLPFHDKGWDEARQRAFIAALAVTGSANRAAKSVGRHPLGADKLRKMRGARGFAEAWEAALEIARERELAAMGPSLKEMAATPDDAAYHPDGSEVSPEEEEEMREQLIQKLLRLAQRLRAEHLAEIRDDPEKRNAYEVLNGPQDWDESTERSDADANASPE